MALADVLGNGSYVFFKSMLNSPIKPFRDAANIAASRLNSINGVLSGKNLDGTAIIQASPEMSQFQVLITSYMQKIKDIASSMRTSEIAYINDMLKQLDSSLIDDTERQALQDLSNGEISESAYKSLINIVNKIQHNKHVEEFRKIIKNQIQNMEVVQDNFKNLDAETRAQVASTYNANYGRYQRLYASLMVRAHQSAEGQFYSYTQSYLSKMAERINKTLKELDKRPEIIQLIKDEYAKHLNDTDFEITDNAVVSQVINTIIEELRTREASGSSGRMNYAAFAGQVADKVMQDINQSQDLNSLSKQVESANIAKSAKSTSKTSIEEQLLTENSNIVTILNGLRDADKIIRDLFPDKADQMLAEFHAIQEKLNAQGRKAGSLKARIDTLNTSMKETFRSSDVGNKLAQALSNNKGISDALDKTTTHYIDSVQSNLTSKLSIKVSKSDLAEILGSEAVQNDLVNIVFNKIGGSMNLKDDVYYAVTVPRVEVPNVNLDPSIRAQIETIFQNTLGKFLENYYDRAEGDTEKKGTTNVLRARDEYTKAMQALVDQLKECCGRLDAETAKQVEEYAKQFETFLGSLTVKEYSLYVDELGYHAGSLGPSGFAALQNIYNMYALGGITPVDLASLQFALLNCADAAIGGAPLRASLEHYLLGGAALMVFDEGFGEANAYLEGMEGVIKDLAPKNLNLYLLNQAYIPASFILESIYQNLAELYDIEFNNCVDDFTARNKVIITNNANEGFWLAGSSPEEMFANTTANTLGQIDIQFIFMAGMLDIFKNLGKAFKV